MKLRNKVCGKKRVILGSSPEGMQRPLRLGRNLYVRTEYSTKDLLSLLNQKLLPAAGYDCRGIRVILRKQ